MGRANVAACKVCGDAGFFSRKSGVWSITSGGYCRDKCFPQNRADCGSIGGKMVVGAPKAEAGRAGGRATGASKATN